MTSALNLISENCKHPFPPLCLILSVSSLPEDHLSSFWVTVSYPARRPVCADLLRDRLPWAYFRLSAFSPPAHFPLSFPLLSSFLFTNSSWLSIHIPLQADDFALEDFSMDLQLSLLSQWPLAHILCLRGKRIQKYILKNGFSSLF